MKMIQDCQTVGDWTVMNADVTTLAASAVGLYGAGSISFAKTNGSGDSTVAGIYATFSGDVAPKVLKGLWTPDDYIVWDIFASALTNVVTSFVRLGTSASHYVEYRYVVASMHAGCTRCSCRLSDTYGAGAGNGLTWENIEYIAAGLNYTLETNALAGIRLHGIWLSKPAEV